MIASLRVAKRAALLSISSPLELGQSEAGFADRVRLPQQTAPDQRDAMLRRGLARQFAMHRLERKRARRRNTAVGEGDAQVGARPGNWNS